MKETWGFPQTVDATRDLSMEEFYNRMPRDLRAIVLEEHRLLEHRLMQLEDPSPPADFTAMVMRRIGEARTRAIPVSEIATALGVELGALAAAVLALLSNGNAALMAGVWAGAIVIALKAALVGVGVLSSMIVDAGTLPVAIALVVTSGVALLGVRRYATPVIVEADQ